MVSLPPLFTVIVQSAVPFSSVVVPLTLKAEVEYSVQPVRVFKPLPLTVFQKLTFVKLPVPTQLTVFRNSVFDAVSVPPLAHTTLPPMTLLAVPPNGLRSYPAMVNSAPFATVTLPRIVLPSVTISVKAPDFTASVSLQSLSRVSEQSRFSSVCAAAKASAAAM